MKCPHCLKEIHGQEAALPVGQDADGMWEVIRVTCPACNRFILFLAKYQVRRMIHHGGSEGWTKGQLLEKLLCRPKGMLRPPPPNEVPEQIAEDYREACLVLPDSAQASAALSRRCLQHILRDVEKVKHGDLFSEIQEVLTRGKLPSHIAESLDAVRNIGNFAAHPTKSKSTGEIVPVEAGEAEWNLDVLEALFDFYFVQPEVIKKKRAALNTKLKDAGKPPLK